MLSSNVEITLLNLCCYFIRRLPYRELSCAGGLEKQTITYKQNPQQVVSQQFLLKAKTLSKTFTTVLRTQKFTKITLSIKLFTLKLPHNVQGPSYLKAVKQVTPGSTQFTSKGKSEQSGTFSFRFFTLVQKKRLKNYFVPWLHSQSLQIYARNCNLQLQQISYMQF